MITNFEFFDEEAIENVITCLHFKMDRVIFFGEKEMLKEHKDETKNFLKRHCNVKEVLFYEIASDNPNQVIKTMQTVIQEEMNKGNECYFDLTGGEGLSLFAFGALSKELHVPVHMYDIANNKFLEFNVETNGGIQKNVTTQQVQFDLEKLIEMHGGKINHHMSKSFKMQHSPEVLKDVEAMWKISHQFMKEWNQYCNFLAENSEELTLQKDVISVRKDLENRSTLNISKLNRMLDACAQAGLLKNLVHANGNYRFTYKNEYVKSCLCDSGSILEQYVYLQEQKDEESIDCQIGVHIDWDGEIHAEQGQDVLNEIDVLSMHHNIPVFISCKNGRVDQHSMYELETVATRFGGKYAKKILAVTKPLRNSHMMRAEEMGIEVRVY